MTLSCKHYELIAEAIRGPKTTVKPLDTNYDVGYADGCLEENAVIAERLAEKFQQLNPQFNRARFLAACGVPE